MEGDRKHVKEAEKLCDITHLVERAPQVQRG